MLNPPEVQTTRHVLSELGQQVSDATILLHEAMAREAGLSGADRKYLSLLMRQGSLTAGEWAKLTGLSTGAITGLIDRLEQKQLVSRTHDGTDRRKIVIVPNAARTRQLFSENSAELQRRVGQLVDTLSAREATVVERYLRASVEIMQGLTQELHERQASTQA